MKTFKIPLTLAVLLSMLSYATFGQMDDLYFNPEEDYAFNDNSNYLDSESSFADENEYYADAGFFEEDDEYPSYSYENDYNYTYASRIRRFRRTSIANFGYFDPFFTNLYFYNPASYWAFGPSSTIYVNVASPYSARWNRSQWNRWNRWNRWNQWNRSYGNNWAGGNFNNSWNTGPAWNNFGPSGSFSNFNPGVNSNSFCPPPGGGTRPVWNNNSSPAPRGTAANNNRGYSVPRGSLSNGGGERVGSPRTRGPRTTKGLNPRNGVRQSSNGGNDTGVRSRSSRFNSGVRSGSGRSGSRATRSTRTAPRSTTRSSSNSRSSSSTWNRGSSSSRSSARSSSGSSRSSGVRSGSSGRSSFGSNRSSSSRSSSGRSSSPRRGR